MRWSVTVGVLRRIWSVKVSVLRRRWRCDEGETKIVWRELGRGLETI